MDKTNSDFITAAEGGKVDIQNVAGIAYSGGKLALGWNYPVVIDLAGMQVAQQLPLMLNHMNRPDCRLGVVNAVNTGSELSFSGGIDMSAPESEMILAGLKAYEWQVSIGANVLASHMLGENKVEAVNGKEFTGPLYIVEKSELREISVVAIGADAETHMRIAASLNTNTENTVQALNTTTIIHQQPEEVEMDETKQTPEVDVQAIRDAEISRIAEINACLADYSGLREKAIQAGWTAEHCKEISATLSAMPKSTTNVIVEKKADNSKTLEAALSISAGIGRDVVAKSCGEQATEEAEHQYSGIGVRDVVMAAARTQGYTGTNMSNDAIRAAFSSISLPGILSNVAGKKLLKAYQAQALVAPRLCTESDISDFKEVDRYRLTDGGNLEKVAEGGEIKSSTLLEEGAANKLDTYGKTLCLTRQMIYNDDLGAFLRIPAMLGARAARKIDELFFTRLLSNPTQSDNKALFSTDHNNYLTGSSSALSKASLENAVKTFRLQTGIDGQPIALSPKYLLVPEALRYAAVELVTGDTLIMSGSDSKIRPSFNAIARDGIEVVSSPYLSNSSYSGNSSTAWYLFADPAVADTFEIGYLRGRRAPTVEQGETDFNTLGMWFRVYFDVGIREQDFRSMVKSNGAA